MTTTATPPAGVPVTLVEGEYVQPISAGRQRLRDPAAMRRYQLPADGGWYRFHLTGPIVAAGSRHAGLIEFWVLHDPLVEPVERYLAVFHSEQTLPSPTPHHLHTVITGSLVWHLMEHG